MLNIILPVLLLAGIMVGLRRGLILQFFHMASAIIAIIAAIMLRDQLVPVLKGFIPMPSLENSEALQMIAGTTGFEQFYYGAIAFIILFIVVKVALSIIASAVNLIAHLPIIKQFNTIGGGIVGFVEIYLILFVLLYLGVLVPNASWQAAINESFVASYIIHDTPYLSDILKNLQPLSFLK